jgi:hypothetical protein
MISERKLFWLAWYYRITLLFGILGLLFSGYVHTFVSPNMLKSYGSITVALSFGMVFFSSFPEYRMDIRYNQLKKELSVRTDFDDTLSSEASSKHGVRRFIKFTTALMIMFVFVIFNILLAAKAYSNNNHPRMFLHMVVIITAFFLFNASLMVYRVDETFKKIEGLISQFRKDQTSEEKKGP